MAGVRRAVEPSLDLLFDTLARDFTKEPAIKENIDNSIQSTILFHLEQLSAAISKHLSASLREISGAASAASAPSKEVFALQAAEMLHVSKGLRFAEAIKDRSIGDLSQLCGRQLPELGGLLQAALPEALVRFWAEMDLLAQCVRERKPRGRVDERSTEPSVLLRFNLDPNARVFSCFDNGRGLNQERVVAIMQLGMTGHGKEADIGRGGKKFDSLGSLCSGQISAYGIGAKGGAASLCSPDNGVAVEGEFLVRSQVEGARAVVDGRQDFAKMREEVLKPGGQPWFFFEGEATQPRQDEKDIMAGATWGRRFTRIQVTGVDKNFCSKLLSQASARLALVSFLNDAYFPFLNDGVGTPAEPATRPLQRVQLTVEFFNGPTRLDSFKLGALKPRSKTQDLKVYPSLAAVRLPTAAQLLARNAENVKLELGGIEPGSSDKAQIKALIARWGDDLTLRLEISLPPPALPSEKALIIFYYMPVLDGDADFCEESAHWKDAHGLLAFQNGCRLPAQNVVVWSFMEQPAGKTNVDKIRRVTLSNSCYNRAIGLLFLPPSCSVNKNKSCLTPEAAAALKPTDKEHIKTFASQIPKLLGANAQPPAGASARACTARRSSRSTSTCGSRTCTSATRISTSRTLRTASGSRTRRTTTSSTSRTSAWPCASATWSAFAATPTRPRPSSSARCSSSALWAATRVRPCRLARTTCSWCSAAQ